MWYILILLTTLPWEFAVLLVVLLGAVDTTEALDGGTVVPCWLCVSAVAWLA